MLQRIAEALDAYIAEFKTDREFSTASGHYLAPVRLYAQAVAAATKLPARGIILVV